MKCIGTKEVTAKAAREETPEVALSSREWKMSEHAQGLFSSTASLQIAPP
jgi:hypothetical protein